MRVLKQHPVGRDGFYYYNGMDTMMTIEIEPKIREQMDEVDLATSRFSHQLIGPVLSMMSKGLLVDEGERSSLIDNRLERHKDLKSTLNEFATLVWSKGLNINSPKQVKDFFFVELKCQPVVRSVKGVRKVKVDRDAMESLAKDYVRAAPFANIIIRMKDLESDIKVLKKPLLGGRFLYGFNIGGTDTGRYNSKEHPLRVGSNIQNIAPDMRHIYVSDPGMVFISCDLKGADSKVVAYKSGDENYLKVVNEADVHSYVANLVWGLKPAKEFTEVPFYRHYTYRFMCKKGGHGSNYMGKPPTLASQMKIEIKIAEEFQEKYFKAFPGIPEWHRWIANKIDSDKMLTTCLGRRRKFWDRTWNDDTLRKAIIYEPQSVVGDLTHIGEYRLWLQYQGPDFQLLINGHDSILLQVPKDQLPLWIPRVLECMTNPVEVEDIHGVKRTMTIEPEVKWGFNYGELTKEKDGTIKNPTGLRPWIP